MRYEIKILNPAQVDNWNNIVKELGGSIFHTVNWYQVLEECYDYKANYFGVFDGEKVVGVVPIVSINSFLTGKRGVSLPFSDYCPVLLEEGLNTQAIISDIMDFGRKNGWKSIEFRGLNCPKSKDLVSDSYYVHQINLEPPYEEILKTFNRKNRMNIKKSAKNNIQVVQENTKEIITKFYQLNCKNKKKNGVPPAPLAFYMKIYEHIINKGLGNIFVAKLNDEIISMGIVFHFRGQVLMKYLAQDYRYQQFRPNNALISEIIKFYAGSTWKVFCFGRTAMHNTGLHQFKKGWGTEVGTLDYHKISLESKTKSSYGQMHRSREKYFSKMPLWMLKMIGNVMYKHIG